MLIMKTHKYVSQQIVHFPSTAFRLKLWWLAQYFYHLIILIKIFLPMRVFIGRNFFSGKKTQLYDLHVGRKGKMVEFAGTEKQT